MVSIADTMKSIEKEYHRSDLPTFDVGDTLKMTVKVTEAEKVRLHSFEGIVIRKSGSGIKSMFTVRKVSFGEGVERTFPLHSPVIESIKIVNRGIIRRAKLYYIRSKVGTKIRVSTEQPKVVATAVAK